MAEIRDASDWEFMEDGAREFVDFLECWGGISLSSGNLTEEDRSQLERGIKLVRRAFDSFSKDVLEPLRADNPSRTKYGYEMAHELMLAAFYIGAYGTLTDSILPHSRKLQAREARDANAAIAEEKNEELKNAILSICEKVSLEINGSRPFAESIQKEVCESLGVSIDARGYSWRSIQRAVSAILKERTKS